MHFNDINIMDEALIHFNFQFLVDTPKTVLRDLEASDLALFPDNMLDNVHIFLLSTNSSYKLLFKTFSQKELKSSDSISYLQR